MELYQVKGDEVLGQQIEELHQKLLECKKIASDISETKIQIVDERVKWTSLDDCIQDLVKQFQESYGFSPESLLVVAQGQTVGGLTRKISKPLYQK